MCDHEYYVYILANTFHRLYIGVTNGLAVRVKQHKAAKDSGSFTARYGIDRLVYFERFQYVQEAIGREKAAQGLAAFKEDSADCSAQSHVARPERRFR